MFLIFLLIPWYVFHSIVSCLVSIFSAISIIVIRFNPWWPDRMQDVISISLYLLKIFFVFYCVISFVESFVGCWGENLFSSVWVECFVNVLDSCDLCHYLFNSIFSVCFCLEGHSVGESGLLKSPLCHYVILTIVVFLLWNWCPIIWWIKAQNWNSLQWIIFL